MPATDELWGSFAVDDHLHEHAFVAEVVLFDRLVIPVPDEDVEWDAAWKPKKLKEMVSKLGELAVPVTWDQQLRDEWQKQYADQRASRRMNLVLGADRDLQRIKEAAPDAPAKWVTRDVIAKKIGGLWGGAPDQVLFDKIKRMLDLNPTANIEVVVGYNSCAKFREEVTLDVTRAGSSPQDTALLFSWDFLVPEGSDLEDSQLLDRAIALSQNSEFRDSRRQFHAWRRQVMERGVSIEAARSEMDRCLVVYNGIVKKAKFRSRTLRALQIVAVSAPLADLLFPGLGMVSGVTLGVGALVAERLFPAPKVGAREKFVALVHDSREAFGA